MGFFDGLLGIGSKILGTVLAPATGGMSLLPSLISGGASLLGGVLTNQANSAQASANRQFQEQMSNTSYQRGVTDMRLAGLNPALAYQNGGASTPTGSLAAPMQNALGAGVSSAMQAASTVANLQNTDADTKLKSSQALQAVATASAQSASARSTLQNMGIKQPASDLSDEIHSAYDLTRQFVDRLNHPSPSPRARPPDTRSTTDDW